MRGKKVLIVEDDAWLRDIFAKKLESAGFDVNIAENALVAAEILEDVLPDAILLDVFLPGPNGLALLHEMRSYNDTGTIPVVVTTSADNFSLKDLEPYGVIRLLDKTTVRPDDIVAAIKKATL